MNTKKILILLMILFLIISFCTGYLMGHSRGIIFQKQQTEKDPCLLRISEIKNIEETTINQTFKEQKDE